MRNEATVYVIYKNRTKNPTAPLNLRVTFAGNPRIYSTNSGEQFTDKEFKELQTSVKKGRKHYPHSVEKAKKIAEDIVKQLGADFSFDTFTERYRRQLYGNYAGTESLQSVFDWYVSQHKRGLAIHTLNDYQAAVNWAKRCKSDVKVGDITCEFVKKLDNLLESEGRAINTKKIYFRELKAIYMFAVKKGLVVDTKPFEGRSLTSTRKTNIGLSGDDFRKIVNYNGNDKLIQFGRDMFVLSFLCNGNYLSDVLRIKNKNIDERGMVRFCREKTKDTGLEICFLLTDNAREIFNRYGELNKDNPNEYVLPFLRGKSASQQQIIVHDINRRVRKGLARLCQELKLGKVTVKQARNTYASLAFASHRSPREIQADLGHTQIQTTIGYINSISSQSLETGKDIKEQYVSTEH
ncbi:MAG: site-specific integrase [Paludibacteraceae bacterium]|nr:site-specific integrase [Paludibacteraceae bacterium]